MNFSIARRCSSGAETAEPIPDAASFSVIAHGLLWTMFQSKQYFPYINCNLKEDTLHYITLHAGKYSKADTNPQKLSRAQHKNTFVLNCAI